MPCLHHHRLRTWLLAAEKLTPASSLPQGSMSRVELTSSLRQGLLEVIAPTWREVSQRKPAAAAQAVPWAWGAEENFSVLIRGSLSASQKRALLLRHCSKSEADASRIKLNVYSATFYSWRESRTQRQSPTQPVPLLKLRQALKAWRLDLEFGDLSVRPAIVHTPLPLRTASAQPFLTQEPGRSWAKRQTPGFLTSRSPSEIGSRASSDGISGFLLALAVALLYISRGCRR